jgi:F-type H+-transporting ATPase subunit epsilon
MSDSYIQTRILSPSQLLVEKKATQVQAPGILGYLGFLYGHVDLVTQLTVGTLTIETKGESPAFFFVTGGYVEYHNNRLDIFVDFLERPEDIDLSRAKSAEERALERLQQAAKEPVDVRRALAALERAIARQKLLHLSAT